MFQRIPTNKRFELDCDIIVKIQANHAAIMATKKEAALRGELLADSQPQARFTQKARIPDWF